MDPKGCPVTDEDVRILATDLIGSPRDVGVLHRTAKPFGAVLASNCLRHCRHCSNREGTGFGRRTFIFENHFCIVDLPYKNGTVEVKFVGPHWDNGSMGEAKTSVGTGNNPADFMYPEEPVLYGP